MKRLVFLLVLGVGMLFLSSCAAKSTPTTAPEEAQTAVTEAATVAPTVPVAMEPAQDYCVTCHTDKQMLIDTAAPVEEAAESESEGVG